MKKFSIVDLLKSQGTVFSFKEILLSSGKTPSALLRRQLHYYVKKGVLYSIRRGLYAKDKNYNKFELGTKIFTPAYVSLETVLAQAGVIFQYYSTIFVITYQTKDIECDGHSYSFRKIKDSILMNKSGLEDTGRYFIASKERAFLDILYLNKNYYFDNLYPIDFEKVFELLPIYGNKRMVRLVKLLAKHEEESEIE